MHNHYSMNLKEVLVLFFTYICSSFSFSQCPPGDVILSRQAHVVDFIHNYGTCEVINGDLLIGGDVTDISALTSIKRIEGSLRLSYADNPSVSNFADLEYVGGDFEIDQCHNIETIEGINKLQTVNGNFIISENYTTLKNIRGFINLSHVGGSFQVSRNLSLISISEFVSLSNIGGRLIFGGNMSIRNLNGFNSLLKIGEDFSIETFHGNLNIEDNFLLEEINGFNALQEIVRSINIIKNPSLSRIIGFENLQIVTSILSIDRSPLLTTIPSFDNLITIGSGLEISETGLTSITGFNNIEVIGDINPSWGNLYIRSNRDLVALDGFARLTKLEGELGITSHPKLVGMNGFLGLTDVRGLNIVANDILTNLDGLQNLIRVGTMGGSAISVRRNPSLTDCSALCSLLTHGIVVGTVYFGNNPSRCSSEMEVNEECIPDFDNDGVLDDDDLDDDNDGILDTVEQNGIPDRDTDGDGFPDHMDLDSDGDLCYDVIEAGFSDGDANGTLGDGPDTVDANGMVTGESNGYTTPIDYDNNMVFDFQENTTLSSGTNGILNICTNRSPSDLFLSLNGSPDIGGTWNPVLTSGTGYFDPAIDAGGIYTYTVSNGICGDSSATVEVIVSNMPNAGNDGFLTLCANDIPLDLFLSLGGNPDSGGTWSPILASGTGIFNPILDNAGLYIYTVTNGSCQNDQAKIEVTVYRPPNASYDTEIKVCASDSPIDLFDQLSGTPDLGGIWSPTLASGSSVFDPEIDLPGQYIYTVSSGLCPDNSTTVRVMVDPVPNAGIDGSLSICAEDFPVDLFLSLGGTPDTDGVWNPGLKSGTGIFNPAIDSSGTYTYTVGSDVCQDHSASVQVTVNSVPNAGEDTDIAVCINEGRVDLFDFIDGTPGPGGIWNPSLASGSNIFDPSIDAAGPYTYTVSTGSCGIDSANLNVSILEVFPITRFNLEITGWSGNNTIALNLATEFQYEYSLDGFTYQSNNEFRNLIGGSYTIFAREVGGCGILEANFSIIDYPRFFTPNNDGINDEWQLIGIGNKLYTIDIFDRYGKLLKQLSHSNPNWDGTYNGRLLPSSDYWFKIKFSDGFVQTGHFSLKR